MERNYSPKKFIANFESYKKHPNGIVNYSIPVIAGTQREGTPMAWDLLSTVDQYGNKDNFKNPSIAKATDAEYDKAVAEFEAMTSTEKMRNDETTVSWPELNDRGFIAASHENMKRSSIVEPNDEFIAEVLTIQVGSSEWFMGYRYETDTTAVAKPVMPENGSFTSEFEAWGAAVDKIKDIASEDDDNDFVKSVANCAFTLGSEFTATLVGQKLEKPYLTWIFEDTHTYCPIARYTLANEMTAEISIAKTSEDDDDFMYKLKLTQKNESFNSGWRRGINGNKFTTPQNAVVFATGRAANELTERGITNHTELFKPTPEESFLAHLIEDTHDLFNLKFATEQAANNQTKEPIQKEPSLPYLILESMGKKHFYPEEQIAAMDKLFEDVLNEMSKGYFPLDYDRIIENIKNTDFDSFGVVAKTFNNNDLIRQLIRDNIEFDCACSQAMESVYGMLEYFGEVDNYTHAQIDEMSEKLDSIINESIESGLFEGSYAVAVDVIGDFDFKEHDDIGNTLLNLRHTRALIREIAESTKEAKLPEPVKVPAPKIAPKNKDHDIEQSQETERCPPKDSGNKTLIDLANQTFGKKGNPDTWTVKIDRLWIQELSKTAYVLITLTYCQDSKKYSVNAFGSCPVEKPDHLTIALEQATDNALTDIGLSNE